MPEILMPEAEDTKQKKLWSQTELAKHFQLDRATIRTRLEGAGVRPRNRNPKHIQYDFEEARIAIERAKDQEWKSLKVEKEAQILDLKLQKELGNFASVAEFAELTQRWVGWLYNKLTIRLPRTVVTKIANAKDKNDAAFILTKEIESVFNEFRANPQKFLDAK